MEAGYSASFFYMSGGGLRLIETGPRGERTTLIDLQKFPITIGRGDADYRVAVGDEWPRNYRENISRIQATIRKQHGQVWLQDGGQRPSANGVYVAQRKIHRPIKLQPGAEVDLSLEIEGCSLKLVWPVDKPMAEEHPTLQFERATVGAELDYSQERIATLETLISTQGEQQKQLVAQQRNLAARLHRELAARRKNDELQDGRIAKLKKAQVVVCGVVGAAAIALLGLDLETLDKIIGGVLALTSILAVASSDR